MSTTNVPAGALVVAVGPSGSGKSTTIKGYMYKCGLAASSIISISSVVSNIKNPEEGAKAFEKLFAIVEARQAAKLTTVIDGTNLSAKIRAKFVSIAQEAGNPAVALYMPTDVTTALSRNSNRNPAQQVTPELIKSHFAQMNQISVSSLHKEGFFRVITAGERVSFLPDDWNGAHLSGKFDILGDIHGCFSTLIKKLKELGYNTDINSPDYLTHPEDRMLVSVGDLCDKGPNSLSVLRWAMDAYFRGRLLLAKGNHEHKLAKILHNSKIKHSPAAAATLQEIKEAVDSEQVTKKLNQWLRHLPTHLVLDNGKLVVAHAGMRPEYVGQNDEVATKFALYGKVIGFDAKTNYPIREDWARTYEGAATVVHGHVVTEKPYIVENTAGGKVVSIDTGIVAGGGLTSFAYPENICTTTATVATDVMMDKEN